ncbi:MAG: hypothetical protein ACLQM8_19300 [Limisphaerales bacterium]
MAEHSNNLRTTAVLANAATPSQKASVAAPPVKKGYRKPALRRMGLLVSVTGSKTW